MKPLLPEQFLFIGLDRDGTIVPHTSNPLESALDRDMRDIIDSLAALPQTVVAVISARALDVLTRDFDKNRVVLAGIYGLEISVPGYDLLIQEAARLVVPDVKILFDRLSPFGDPSIGAIMEADAYSLCLWWQSVSEPNKQRIEQEISLLAERYENMNFIRLEAGWEILPRMDWNKSMAMDQIVAKVVPSDSCCKYVYAGDASSDEPVFRWVNERSGVSIRVGPNNVQTEATFTLPDVESTRQFLKRICQIRS